MFLKNICNKCFLSKSTLRRIFISDVTKIQCLSLANSSRSYQHFIQPNDAIGHQLNLTAWSSRVTCPFTESSRNLNFFNKNSADKLWKGLISVSNAGRKKGRGKGNQKKVAKNLNYGQRIGSGNINMIWPGLNAPVIKGKEIVRHSKLPPDKERMEKLLEMRNKMGKLRVFKIEQLDRGWTGKRLPGQRLGPPDPEGEETFEGFETVALEYKPVSIMHGRLGRKRRMSLLAVTGNGNGVAGFGLSKGSTQLSCVRLSKKKAVQRLMYFDRCDGHTVYHNFYSEYLYSKVYAERKPKGYGLRCSRVIREICKVIGIKDLYAKIDGSTNVQNVTKAFFLGLSKQRTYQQLADDKKLHLVRLRSNDMPRIMATPQNEPVRSNNEINMDEELDYDLYTMNNVVVERRKKRPLFYTKLPSYERYLKKQEHRRNREKIRRHLFVEHGGLVSFLKEKHPECDARLIVVENED